MYSFCYLYGISGIVYTSITKLESISVWLSFISIMFIFIAIALILESIITSLTSIVPHKKYKFPKIQETEMDNRFKEAYNHIPKESMSKLTKMQMKIMSLFLFGWLLFGLLGLFSEVSNPNLRILIVGCVLLGVILIPSLIALYRYIKYKKSYVEIYKNNIIKKFVEHITPNLYYHPQGGENLFNYYLDAKFEDEKFNNFVADDYIKGFDENNISVEMCNISLENVNSKGKFLNMIYEGIFSVTKLNYFLPNEIRIKKNSLILKNNNNKVEMDSAEFEKYFDVYSDSDILAMEILTHDIMEDLVYFYNKYKIDFEIVIKGNSIYIRFNTGVMFEPNILSQEFTSTLWVYYSILKFVIDITIKINKLLRDVQI